MPVIAIKSAADIAPAAHAILDTSTTIGDNTSPESDDLAVSKTSGSSDALFSASSKAQSAIQSEAASGGRKVKIKV